MQSSLKFLSLVFIKDYKIWWSIRNEKKNSILKIVHEEACQTRKNLIELNFPPMSMLTTETDLDACQKKRWSVLRTPVFWEFKMANNASSK